jgi:hypothetical protein
MKTNIRLIIVTGLAVCAALWAMPGTARGEQLFASVSGTNQNGGGSIFQYAPGGTLTTFASGLDEPRGLAFDSVGNLFVATNTSDSLGNSQGTIFKFTPDGVMSTFATGFPANFFLNGMATDTAGDVFVMAIDENTPFPNNPSTIYKITPGGTVSTFGSIPGLGIGLAFDSAGNLYAADGPDQTVYKFTPGGTQSVFVGSAAFSSVQGPAGLAFDQFGNLFVSNGGSAGNDAILKFTVNPDGTEGTESVFATGLNNPRGLAFDASGNLFVAEFVAPGGNLTTGDILEFTPGGGAPTVFASGIRKPTFLAFPPVAQVQQPINPDGSSVFSVKRGVVPVKFTLTQGGNPTCALPPATIALTRTSGGTIGAIDENVYIGPADTGSNFRIDSCQYVYNLSASALGVGTYRIDIKINGLVVGSAVFQLK